jgi:histone deacetylase 6
LFWKADVLKNYVEWAATHGFGVIDVNIPHFLTGISVNNIPPHPCSSHTDRLQVEGGDEEDEILKMDLATNELAIYLWENYIECNDSTKVMFMGVGEAYKAILHILNTRNCKCNARLKLRSSFPKSPYSPSLPSLS